MAIFKRMQANFTSFKYIQNRIMLYLVLQILLVHILLYSQIMNVIQKGKKKILQHFTQLLQLQQKQALQYYFQMVLDF